MTQTAIPYLFMRGGSSRGPFFNKKDLPESRETLADVLVSALGSGHALNIDGIGGGNAVTTKVAILSESTDEWADVDYFFAQVSVLDRLVDFKPTCGNIMIAVGAAAVEMGLVEPSNTETTVNIHAVNTGAKVSARIQTPSGVVNYDGDTTIDGVPGSAAPVALNFSDVAGSSTGALLPTKQPLDIIDGISVSCIDFAMPMVIAKAEDFGITGYESREELDANKTLFKRIESVRLKAALKMGMGECHKSVTPKFGLISAAANGGTLSARYFMPWTTHPTLAVTGSQCISACALIPGTVADGLLERPVSSPSTLKIEHPLGFIDVVMTFETANGVHPISAGVVRTARKLASGDVFVPGSVWTREKG